MPYIGHEPTNAGTFYLIDSLTMSSSTTYTLQIGGVDITPIIWVGLLSLFRELFLGQQGLLTQIIF